MIKVLTAGRILGWTFLLVLIASLKDTDVWAQSNQSVLNAAGAAQGQINGYQYEYSLGGVFAPGGFGGSSPVIITPEVIQPYRSQAPLPVTLINFEGKPVESYVSLTWTSSFEHNSSHFEIQRSKDARTWQIAGQVDAGGESHGIAHYFFNDLNPVSGIGYYRLKIVDLDASRVYSKIISIDRGAVSLSERSLVLYPNPVQRYVTLSSDSKTPIQKVDIFDAAGRSVYRSILAGENRLDLDQLQSGTYQLQATPVAGSPIIRTLIKR